MKSGKPLVLVVNQRLSSSGTVQRRARRGVGQRSHLRLVAAEGVALAKVVGAAGARVAPVSRTVSHVSQQPAPSRPVSRQPSPAPLALVPAELTSLPAPRPPRSLSRPFGQRIVQAANDVAVLAIALLSGLRPRA